MVGDNVGVMCKVLGQCVSDGDIPCKSFARLKRYQNEAVKAFAVCMTEADWFLGDWNVGADESPVNQVIE